MHDTWLCLLVPFLLFFAVTASRDCQKVASLKSGWTVKCPTYLLDYAVHSQVKVTCTQFVSPYAPDMFTDYDFSRVRTYQFVECPLPENSFGQVLAGLEVSVLIYQVYEHAIDLKSDLFLGLPDLEVLSLSFETKTDIPEDLFQHLNNLLSLQLSIGLSSVPENLFRNLGSLINLEFVKNSFTTLPKNVFSSLGNLTALLLDSGALEELPAEIFYSLTQLEILSLRNNNFWTISKSHMHRLRQLTYFDMSGNRFEALDGDLFQGNLNLGSLDLGDNPTLPSLPHNLLQNLNRLENLTISNCNLTDIPETFFSYAPNLERLYMQNNRISNISSVIFSRNPYLKVINMLYNDVLDITADAFVNLPNLESFVIAKNNIYYFPRGLFDRTTRLSELDASATFLEGVQENLFQSLHRLRSLKLMNNLIDVIDDPEPFGPGTNLELLDLSYNYLENTNTINWTSYVHLKELNLNYNSLFDYSLPVLYSKSTNILLQSSHISRVSVDALQEYMDGLPATGKNSTITFYLENNDFNCDCRMYRFAEFVKNSISSGKRKSYSVRFNQPQNFLCRKPHRLHLEPLILVNRTEFVCNIYDSCPESCDCYVRAFDSVTVVNCTDRGLKTLPSTLPFNTTELYCSHNKLTSLNGLAGINLTILDASNNQIVSADWSLPSTLTELLLQGNELTWFPSSIQTLITTNADVQVYLANNPFPCNCFIENLKSLLSTNPKKFPDKYSIYCTTSGPHPYKLLLIHVVDYQLCPAEAV